MWCILCMNGAIRIKFDLKYNQTGCTGRQRFGKSNVFICSHTEPSCIYQRAAFVCTCGPVVRKGRVYLAQPSFKIWSWFMPNGCSWKQLDVTLSGSKYCSDSEGRMRVKAMCWLNKGFEWSMCWFISSQEHLLKSWPLLSAVDRFIPICALTEDSQT